MEGKSIRPLTHGPILQVLARLAIPIMTASFLSTAYSITDMIWVGKLGSKAVAGVGVGGMYVWLSQGLATLARMGGQVHVGQALGRGEREEAGHYTAAALQMVIFFGLLFGAICLLLPDLLIGFFKLEEELTKGYAKSYLMITCGTCLLPFVNTTITGLRTAQGDSKSPLKANTVGLVLNMILDPVLILGIGPFPRWEVVGAAVATVTAQAVVMVLLIVLGGEEDLVRSCRMTRPAPRAHLIRVFRMGGPAALQTTVYCGISMVLTRMVAGFGEGAIAVQQVGGHIESVSWNMADGFGAAMNAFCAQNYGAGKPDRLRKGYDLSAAVMTVWGSLVAVVFILMPEGLSGLFFHEAEVIPLAVTYFIVLGFSEPFMCVELMSAGALSGLGRTDLCSIISIVLTGARIPLALILSGTSLGLDGIWWALTLSSMAKGILFYLASRRTIRRVRAEETAGP